jgi:hypothetical protein
MEFLSRWKNKIVQSQILFSVIFLVVYEGYCWISIIIKNRASNPVLFNQFLFDCLYIIVGVGVLSELSKILPKINFSVRRKKDTVPQPAQNINRPQQPQGGYNRP